MQLVQLTGTHQQIVQCAVIVEVRSPPPLREQRFQVGLQAPHVAVETQRVCLIDLQGQNDGALVGQLSCESIRDLVELPPAVLAFADADQVPSPDHLGQRCERPWLEDRPQWHNRVRWAWLSHRVGRRGEARGGRQKADRGECRTSHGCSSSECPRDALGAAIVPCPRKARAGACPRQLRHRTLPPDAGAQWRRARPPARVEGMAPCQRRVMNSNRLGRASARPRWNVKAPESAVSRAGRGCLDAGSRERVARRASVRSPSGGRRRGP